MTDPSSPPDTALAAIRAFNHGRDPVLVARKYAAMRRGPFAFLRGTCHLFASEWPADGFTGVPRVWLSGDLHAENFGAYKGDNRLTYFDATDFDETALGALTWDVGRFLTSLLVGAGEWGIEGAEAPALAARALVAYRTELRTTKPAWLERESARGMAKRLFAQVSGRSRADLLDRYTVRKGHRRRIAADARHLIAANDTEREQVRTMMDAVGARAGDPAYFEPIDVAGRVSGLGSIGLPRFLVLIEGRGSPDRNVLLDVKAAHPSVIAWRIPEPQPGWDDDATRVVTVQRHAVVVPPAFLQPARTGSESYLVRELQPTADRVHLKEWLHQPRKLADAVVAMAAVMAWMHLRGAAWRGSEPAEHLADFAADDRWSGGVLDAAHSMSARTADEFRTFAAAYDAGALSEEVPGTPGSTEAAISE